MPLLVKANAYLLLCFILLMLPALPSYLAKHYK